MHRPKYAEIKRLYHNFKIIYYFHKINLLKSVKKIYKRKNMQYIEISDKSVQEVVEKIKEIAPNYKFGVLHVHNIKETLKSKGKDLSEDCQVLDICNPNVAETFLNEDITLSCIMPCKIAVYTKDGETNIALNSVVQLVDDINPDLIELAQTTQEDLLKIIDEA